MSTTREKKKEPISIFVSSTFKDLASYRNEVETKLVSLEQSIKGMEYFGASSDTPMDVCKEKLRECKLMVLLIGVSYGSIEPKSKKSYTENEYDYAQELGVPIICYFANTSSPDLEIPIDAIDIENRDLLNDFKERIKSEHLVSEFTSIKDLGARILHDIPAELDKLSVVKASNVTESNADVTEEQLKAGASQFEMFWLRPQKLSGKVVPLRIRINKKLGGWKIKDELVRSLGLTVGDTISTEVSVQLTSGLIDDNGDTDVFADGEAADWLVDTIHSSGFVEGSIIDCYVRFVYNRAPVGSNGKTINKVSLVLMSGIKYVGFDNNYVLTNTPSSINETDIFRALLKSAGE